MRLMRIVHQAISLVKRVRSEMSSNDAFTYLAIVTFGLFFSFVTILRFHSLSSDAWDLGNYNQAMYTFFCCGKPFYWTADILNNTGGSLFGIHFSPIFYLLTLPYAFFPHPETLLVIQSFALSLGALPLYWLAKSRL